MKGQVSYCPFCQTELDEDDKIYIDDDEAVAGCEHCIRELTVKEYEDGEF